MGIIAQSREMAHPCRSPLRQDPGLFTDNTIKALPPSIRELGRVSWFLLEYQAVRNVETFKRWLTTFLDFYPCKLCRDGIPDTLLREGLITSAANKSIMIIRRLV